MSIAHSNALIIVKTEEYLEFVMKAVPVSVETSKLDFMSKKILITFSAGFLAAHFCEKLLNERMSSSSGSYGEAGSAP